MKDFFKVSTIPEVLALAPSLPRVGIEQVPLAAAVDRVLAEAVVVDEDLPPFARSTMDGYAVAASSTFGASEANPAYLTVVGSVTMGALPRFAVKAGEAARIATGGMLPHGADAVVMVEHAGVLDETTIEIYRSVAPGHNAVIKGEDFTRGQTAVVPGVRLRPQEIGLLAAIGWTHIRVFRQPIVAVISTGDEIVAVDAAPGPGQIRDINTFSVSAQIARFGAGPLPLGIVADDPGRLDTACRIALDEADMVLISGGSSVGARDYTIEVLSKLPDSVILVHGIAISPGKPTIFARCAGKPVWGLPGHPVSAMVVMDAVVRPFVTHIGGLDPTRQRRFTVPARLSRNLASAQGRVDFVRVRLRRAEDRTCWADPLLGKSSLINTLVQADGLIEIHAHCEGLEKGAQVEVRLFE